MKLKIDNLLNLLKDKSGSICAAVACVGVGTTAYLSSKAGVQAYVTIDSDLDTKEKIKQYAKCYWKVGLSAALTVGAIIGSDRIHVGKEVALAGVAAVYKDKFIRTDRKLTEEVGEERAAEIRKEIASEKMAEQSIPEEDDEERNGNLIRIYEPYSDQYIYTTQEKIDKTMLLTNKELVMDGKVRLNFIIKHLGGKPTPKVHRFGWSWDNEIQDYNWGFFGGAWIEPMDGVTKDGVRALFYNVEPEDIDDPDFNSLGWQPGD